MSVEGFSHPDFATEMRTLLPRLVRPFIPSRLVLTNKVNYPAIVFCRISYQYPATPRGGFYLLPYGLSTMHPVLHDLRCLRLLPGQALGGLINAAFYASLRNCLHLASSRALLMRRLSAQLSSIFIYWEKYSPLGSSLDPSCSMRWDQASLCTLVSQLLATYPTRHVKAVQLSG